MANMVDGVKEMSNAIENPTNWLELIYETVIEVKGFLYSLFKEVFDYLEENEKEDWRFMVKRLDMKKA